MKKEFNENPFKKNTPVIPFSNNTEAMIWKEQNCLKCSFYDDTSININDAKCKLAFHLDIGFAIGSIPLWVAKEIGCDYDPLYQTCKLFGCSKLDDGKRPF